MPVTVQCKSCGHILYQGRDLIIVRPGRNSSFSVLEVFIGTSCPACGRILQQPRLDGIEIHIAVKGKSKLLMEMMAH